MKFIITSNFISLLSTSAMPNGFFCCTFTESPVAVCKATDSKSFIVKSIFGLVSFCTSLYFMEILSIPFFCTLFTFTHTQRNEIFCKVKWSRAQKFSVCVNFIEILIFFSFQFLFYWMIIASKFKILLCTVIVIGNWKHFCWTISSNWIGLASLHYYEWMKWYV